VGARDPEDPAQRELVPGGDAGHVAEFETAWANLLGARRCLATASGTTALITSLYVVGIDAGDEVIVSPYTFNATYNAILLNKALPVFADTDPATWNIDPASIESRITERTRAILPVHIYGLPCDMDPINAIAKKHDLAVVEDACQAWLAEYKGKKCGTLADLACFSFQNSKHIPSGEGGAVTGNRDDLLDRCHAFHNCGRATGSFQGSGCFTRGSNFRMQHFQAAMLLQQIDKLVQETQIRQANADYLIAQLNEIPGITPARVPENSRAVWHLFPMRYDAEHFHGLSRAGFMRALRAEGIPSSTVYGEQYFDGMLDEAIASRGYQRLFGAKRLKDYRDSFEELDRQPQVCATTVALSQSMLLAEDSIAPPWTTSWTRSARSIARPRCWRTKTASSKSRCPASGKKSRRSLHVRTKVAGHVRAALRQRPDPPRALGGIHPDRHLGAVPEAARTSLRLRLRG
jgi:perosamine synthetase